MSQQIYKATYSGVPVYEMTCNGVAVMRRKNDSYMNATQILKVADFDKPQRTRILEREVQIDEHEKIQGGYGKYQGTWVPFEKAARLAMNYNVDYLIRPLLDFAEGDDSPPLAPKHATAASAKPRKPRERRARKKAKHLDDGISDINDDDAGLSLKEDPSQYAQTPSPRRQHRRTAAGNVLVNDPADSDGSAYSENDVDLQSKTTRHSRHKRTKMSTQLDYMDIDDLDDDMDTKPIEKTAPPSSSTTTKGKHQQRQKANKSSLADKSMHRPPPAPHSPSLSPDQSSSTSTSLPPSTADRTSTTRSSSAIATTPTIASTKHRTKKEVEHERTYAHKLLAHFHSENEGIPALLQRPPRDLDVNVIIDEEGHTCLHWAAVMGHMATVQHLIDLDADIYRVNYKGQTALMRSVLYTNNYDQKTFQQLLGLLSGTIFNIDKSDQTVFHHVTATAGIGKGKIHASRYYMENLINKLLHNRSELISILNVQDVCGDTALTIASRLGNQKLVQLLIDAGASTEIANEKGMTAQDYLTALDQHSGNKTSDTGLDGDLSTTSTGTTTAAFYQSEEKKREQVRRKVDSMYKTMLSGITPTSTTPTLSHWVDDLAASYERELNKKELTIRERQRETQMVIKRLDETKKLLDLWTPTTTTTGGGGGDDGRGADGNDNQQQQQIQQILDQGDRLSQELRQVLLYTQEIRLGKWIKEKEGGNKNGFSTSNSMTASSSIPQTSTATTTTTNTTTTHTDDNSTTTTDKGNDHDTHMKEAHDNKDNDDKATLATRFSELQQTRRELMIDMMTHRTNICDKRIQNYKRLISMCCNIAYENVDSMLTPILMSFDEAGAITNSTKEAIITPTTS